MYLLINDKIQDVHLTSRATPDDELLFLQTDRLNGLNRMVFSTGGISKKLANQPIRHLGQTCASDSVAGHDVNQFAGTHTLLCRTSICSITTTV